MSLKDTLEKSISFLCRQNSTSILSQRLSSWHWFSHGASSRIQISFQIISIKQSWLFSSILLTITSTFLHSNGLSVRCFLIQDLSFSRNDFSYGLNRFSFNLYFMTLHYEKILNPLCSESTNISTRPSIIFLVYIVSVELLTSLINWTFQKLSQYFYRTFDIAIVYKTQCSQNSQSQWSHLIPICRKISCRVVPFSKMIG